MKQCDPYVCSYAAIHRTRVKEQSSLRPGLWTGSQPTAEPRRLSFLLNTFSFLLVQSCRQHYPQCTSIADSLVALSARSALCCFSENKLEVSFGLQHIISDISDNVQNIMTVLHYYTAIVLPGVNMSFHILDSTFWDSMTSDWMKDI